MVTLNAHFDGKVFVPDEPPSLAPNQKVRLIVAPRGPNEPLMRFTPNGDLTASLMNGDAWDESDALHIDPLDATPDDFVRRPGTAAGQIKMSDDFNDTPDDFKEYL